MVESRPLVAGYPPARIEQLRSAMSASAMRDLLSRDWTYPKRRGLALLDCQAVRVYPRATGEFVLEYEIRLRNGQGEQSLRAFGELVGEAAEDRCRRTILRLQKRRRGQMPKNDLTDCIACFPRHGLVLRVAGLDEEIHDLRHLQDPAALRVVLSSCLPMEGAPGAKIETAVLNHRLGKRCVVRCSFGGDASGPPAIAPRSVILKYYKTSDDRAQRTFSLMQALWDGEFGAGEADGIRIPKPLALAVESQMVVMEDVLGCNPSHADVSGIEAAGRALAKLHSSAVRVSARHSADDEIGLLQGWVAVTSQVFPVLASALGSAFAKVSAALRGCRTFTPGLVHRDFYEKQVLIDGRSTVLIDFDTVCVADPAIDVGNFLAHQRLAELQGLGDASRSETAFLAGYRDAAASVKLFARMQPYTSAALLRLACLYALWPRWHHLAAPLIRQIG